MVETVRLIRNEYELNKKQIVLYETKQISNLKKEKEHYEQTGNQRIY